MNSVWCSPIIERDRVRKCCEDDAAISYKWVVIDILLSLCLAIEIYVGPVFALLKIPYYLYSLYNTLLYVILAALLACVSYHLIRLVWIKFGRDKRAVDRSPRKPNILSDIVQYFWRTGSSMLGPSMFSPYRTNSFASRNKLTTPPKMYSSVEELELQADKSLLEHSGTPGLPTLRHHLSKAAFSGPATPPSYRSPGHSFDESFSRHRSFSILDTALSPIAFPKSSPDSRQTDRIISPLSKTLDDVAFRSEVRNRHHLSPCFTWSSFAAASTVPLPHFQYQVAYLSRNNPGETKTDLFTRSVSAADTPPYQLNEKESQCDEYWSQHNVTSDDLEKWTLDLRKWLHGTVVRRLVDEINRVNSHLSEASGEETIIGATTLDTLQRLCVTKCQYLPTLPVLVAFLDCTKDQGYLVNRLRELTRGGCLEEYRWDGGSRSPTYPWKEHLPNDSLIILHLFSTYMDTRVPPHPKCLNGRAFSQLCVVRHPDKPDLKSKYNCQVYQLGVQPALFKLVLGGKIYTFPLGRKNLYHVILMFFHYYYTLDKKFRLVELGSSGLNVAWIFEKH